MRYAKPARLLAPDGALAVVDTKHVLPSGGDEFWVEVQADYDAVVPSDRNRPPPHPDDVSDRSLEFEAAGFRSVSVRRHLWDVTYGSDEYLGVLGTYSANLALDPGTRRSLFERIHARVEAAPGRTRSEDLPGDAHGRAAAPAGLGVSYRCDEPRAQQAIDAVDEIARVERLLHVLVRPGRHAASDVGRLSPRGQEDDRRGARRCGAA